MKLEIVSMFPRAFESFLGAGLLGKAIESGIVEIDVHDLRTWAPPPHAKLDDLPFGGGAGMVMTPGPIVEAVESLLTDGPSPVLLCSASGERFDQRWAAELSEQARFVIVCGRYEGVDHRVVEILGAREVSIGDYVLAGGEAAALVIVEAVTRLLPGVMGNPQSLQQESFAEGLLEYPQYTRPAEYRGLSVPDVLLSGHHQQISMWRREQALQRTWLRRPELLEGAELTEQEALLLARWRSRPEDR